MKRLRPAFLAAALAVGLSVSSGPLHAHVPIYGVGTQSRIAVKRDRIVVLFDLSYNDFWAQGEMISMDTNRDSEVSKEEADRYLESRWEKKIAPNLKFFLDGREVPLRRIQAYHDGLVGEIYPGPFSLYYELEIPAPEGRFAAGRLYTLEIQDAVTRGETPGKPRYLVPFAGHGSEEEPELVFRPEFVEPQSPLLDPQGGNYVLEGDKLVMRFEFAPGADSLVRVEEAGAPAETQGDAGSPGGEGAAGSGEGGAAERAALRAPEAAGPEAEAAGAGPSSGVETPPGRARPAAGGGEVRVAERMTYAILHFEELGFWAALGFLLLAFAYGAGHAFTPGHGKAMVAAYLIGTKGRIRDAVILGITVTFTHTVSVYVIGLVVFLLAHEAESSRWAGANKAMVVTSLISGLLFVAMGLGLFLRRWRALQRGESLGHTHSHGHGHGHSHSHFHSHSHGHSHAHSHTHTHTHAHSPERVHGRAGHDGAGGSGGRGEEAPGGSLPAPGKGGDGGRGEEAPGGSPPAPGGGRDGGRGEEAPGGSPPAPGKGGDGGRGEEASGGSPTAPGGGGGGSRVQDAAGMPLPADSGLTHRGPGPGRQDLDAAGVPEPRGGGYGGAAQFHGHGHTHKHTHEHGLPEERPRLRELLALGFAGGLLPCPAGLVVVGLGLQLPLREVGQLLFAISLLVFFSLGLGTVLVGIGVLLITGKLLARERVRDGAFFQEIEPLRRIFAPSFLAALDRAGARLLRVLPAFSCLVVAALGAFFVTATVIRGRTELADMARAVADWLGS